jgi:type II secretory pathway component GspD/PulD (secretin)
MRAMFGKAKELALTLSMSVVLLSSPSFAQDFTVNLKDTDIQEFIEFVSGRYRAPLL